MCWPLGRGAEDEVGDRATTQAGTRYGCFLPDLTGLARGLPAADLPPHYIISRHRRGKSRTTAARLARLFETAR